MEEIIRGADQQREEARVADARWRNVEAQMEQVHLLKQASDKELDMVRQILAESQAAEEQLVRSLEEVCSCFRLCNADDANSEAL